MMKCEVERASEYYSRKSTKRTMVFDTLEELLAWQKGINSSIIIDMPENGVYHIIIYDDYIE